MQTNPTDTPCTRARLAALRLQELQDRQAAKYRLRGSRPDRQPGTRDVWTDHTVETVAALDSLAADIEAMQERLDALRCDVMLSIIRWDGSAFYGNNREQAATITHMLMDYYLHGDNVQALASAYDMEPKTIRRIIKSHTRHDAKATTRPAGRLGVILDTVDNYSRETKTAAKSAVTRSETI